VHPAPRDPRVGVQRVQHPPVGRSGDEPVPPARRKGLVRGVVLPEPEGDAPLRNFRVPTAGLGLGLAVRYSAVGLGLALTRGLYEGGE